MSGRVRNAFRERGHEAYSCDLLPALDASPYHIQDDAKCLLKEQWDLLIAHPPCTYLCNAGVRWLFEGEGTVFPSWIDVKFNTDRYYQMLKARAFFLSFWHSGIPKIAIENPIPHKYAGLPPYTQTIQPYQFGEDASKRTCLWLKGLPELTPTEIIPPGSNGKYGNQTPSGQNKLGPSPDRAMLRSLTYPGIANAFAEQWG